MESTSPLGEHPTADPVSEFRGIVQDIRDAVEESCGVESVERDLERALDVLKSNPGSREAFEEVLVSVIESLGEGAVELISFTMHELRWQAVEEAVTARVSAPGRNVSDLRLYEAMLDAFSDSWRDRDLYARFDRQDG
ncbi:hypothetical protein [Streptomyces capitiformicae]|uniref:Uncharacterized protein n=1 Tax=Streptomyces capitiformicae TaxID=2014920 RepID=A0A918ZI54_9ACTN|nr:hypothetical protein [Streptomyces capitiformicae]GHE54163.1 hypothetical protein GCM10017771_76530 [Streptomyces capitiformicae]